MTIELHPEYLSKNGKKKFVVLPYEEFEALQELLEDLEDAIDLQNAKLEEADKPSISLSNKKWVALATYITKVDTTQLPSILTVRYN